MIKAIKSTPSEDYLSITEAVIDKLRTISNWDNKPKGLDGLILIANKDKDSKLALSKFLDSLPSHAWLNVIKKGIK